MAKKYTQLPTADPLTGNEIFAVVQDGVSVQTTVSQIQAGKVSIVNWSFPSGAFPTSANVLYIATTDHGSIGDPDYVAQGTWFISKSTSPNPSGYSDFNYK